MTNVIRCFRLFLPALLLCAAISAGQAQNPAPTTPPATTPPATPADTIGSALLEEFRADYDVVFKAIQDGLTKAGYEVNYASKKRSLIETSFRQIANEDNFFDVMNKYGDVPYIRSPAWSVGRVKITVTLEQVDSNRVGVKVIALMSGFEERFTNLWHYWRSNGKLEEETMAPIITEIETVTARKKQLKEGQ